MIEESIKPKLDEAELRSSLPYVRHPNELEDEPVGWNCGTPTWTVRNMVNEWKTNISWEKPRNEIERWHHYQTFIDNLKIYSNS